MGRVLKCGCRGRGLSGRSPVNITGVSVAEVVIAVGWCYGRVRCYCRWQACLAAAGAVVAGGVEGR